MAYLDNIKVFVRVFELGSLSSAGRDQRSRPYGFGRICNNTLWDSVPGSG